MDSQAGLHENLATLRKRSPRLADALETAELGEVVTGKGPRGWPTITDHGMLLASAYAPDAEGRRMADDMNRNEPDLMIALGFGLGHHLEAFRETNKCPLIVFEPSLARLRAALSVRARLKLLSKTDVFVVSDLSDLQILVSHLYTSGLSVGVYPLPSFMRLCPETVREALGRIKQAKDAMDLAVVTRVQKLAEWAWVTAGNGDHLRDTPSLSRLFGAFEGTTAVIACAGPSLTKQLPRLAAIRDRVLLISIGQAVGSLRQAGMEPDFVHVLESLPVGHQLENGGSSATLNLVVTPDVDRSLFECPAAHRFVAAPNSNRLACWLYRTLGDDRFLMGGGSVAHGAVSVAAALGASRIVLLGQDLAFTDGQAYASGSAYAETGFEECEGGKFRWKNVEAKHEKFASLNWELRNPEQEVLWVDGWADEKVPTSRAYSSFIDQYVGMTTALEKLNVELINCTEGGARIPRMRHERFEAIEALIDGKVDTAAIIERATAGSQAPPPDVFETAIQSAREMIDSLEEEASGAIEEADRGLERFEASKLSGGRTIKILKRNKRLQKKIQQKLDELPWLDDIVQPELQSSEAQLRRTHGVTPGPEEALEVTLVQLRAVEVGVQRARLLLDRLEEALQSRS